MRKKTRKNSYLRMAYRIVDQKEFLKTIKVLKNWRSLRNCQSLEEPKET
jgi:hypothetical protein